MDISIREATSDDAPEILRQRRGMYQDMGYEDKAALDKMVSVCEAHLVRAIVDHSFRAWLALGERGIVGGGGVIVSPWLSIPMICSVGARRFSTSMFIHNSGDAALGVA
jgi:hypothetical protein